MTRKDYEAIARVISQELAMARQIDSDEAAVTAGSAKNYNQKTIIKLARELSAVFAQDNPRFDVTRFHNACGF